MDIRSLLRRARLLGAVVVGATCFATAAGQSPNGGEQFRLFVPEWVPSPPAKVMQGMSVAKVELGRHLFYDRRLSLNNALSCSSCHVQALAFTDGQPVHAGFNGEPGIRNAPGLANLAWMPVLNWANPSVHRIEQQVLVPIFGENPAELGMVGQENELFARLNGDTRYQRLLTAAYPGKNGYDLEAVTGALGAFVRSLVSWNSSYDRYKRGGVADAISAAARRGEELFFSDELECSHCHGGLNFTDNFQSAALAFPEVGFHNTGLYNEDGRGSYPRRNPGIRELTGLEEDEGKFRSPSLRNVAVTAPYMHDGSVASLRQVILDHYAVAGRASRSTHGASPRRDPLIAGFSITDAQVEDLVAFLEALTDDAFLRNPAYASPWGADAASSGRQ